MGYILVSAACFYTSCGEDGFLLRRMIFISHQLLRMSVVRLGRNLRAGFREWVSGSLVLCASVGRALACPEGSQALRFSLNLSWGERNLAPARNCPPNSPPPPLPSGKAPGRESRLPQERAPCADREAPLRTSRPKAQVPHEDPAVPGQIFSLFPLGNVPFKFLLCQTVREQS